MDKSSELTYRNTPQGMVVSAAQPQYASPGMLTAQPVSVQPTVVQGMVHPNHISISYADQLAIAQAQATDNRPRNQRPIGRWVRPFSLSNNAIQLNTNAFELFILRFLS